LANTPTTIPITILNNVIDFPISASSPNWAPALVQFALLVQEAFLASIGPFDIAPQKYDLSGFNPASNQNVVGLSFSTVAVRGAIIRYTVYRSSNLSTLAECGLMQIVYNPTNSPGNLWEITREYAGDAHVTFNITDLGQVQISSDTLSGSDYVANITFAAQALQQ
jgi:hypothetical protein